MTMHFPCPADAVLGEEESLVAELERLGIRYLSRHIAYQASGVRPPATLLADLVRQPSARVRAAVISTLLVHPEFARAMPAALAQLPPDLRKLLRILYTAARLLQREYAARLYTLAGGRPLPKRYAIRLPVPDSAPVREQLAVLADKHRGLLHQDLNWAGTYESAARSLARSYEAASRWKR